MKNLILICSLFFITNFSFAQGIVGNWETYDDKTNELKSIVEIYKKGDLYFGKIKEVLTKGGSKTCTACEGDKKNVPIIGLELIENMKQDGDEYNGGTITDPESGSVYKCLLALENNDKLKVRGYIGFSLLGRTQYWKRKK